MVSFLDFRQEEEDGSDPSSSSSGRSEPSMYMEKVHWMKGPLLGTGAYSTCYQARDARTGVIMAVKQVLILFLWETTL